MDACNVEGKLPMSCLNTGRRGLGAVYAVMGTELSLTCMQCTTQITLCKAQSFRTAPYMEYKRCFVTASAGGDVSDM